MDFIDFACDMLNKKYKNISNAEWIDVYDDYLFEAIARGQKWVTWIQEETLEIALYVAKKPLGILNGTIGIVLIVIQERQNDDTRWIANPISGARNYFYCLGYKAYLPFWSFIAL